MKKLIRLISAVVLIAVSQSAFSDEEPRNSQINVGANLTAGNSDTLQINVGASTERNHENRTIKAAVDGAYGEADDETNVENIKALLGVRHKFDIWYNYVDATIARDTVADINYRLITGPGIGRFLLNQETLKLSLETGLSYIREELDELDAEDKVAARIAEFFEWKPSETSKVWQEFEYFPRLGGDSEYLMFVEAGVEAAVNSHVHLRLVIRDKFNEMPAPGKKKNDVEVIAGLGVKW